MNLRVYILTFAILTLAAGTVVLPTVQAQQPAFAVAAIRLSGGEVKFEKDGSVETTPGTVHLRDVTLAHCIRWAYDVQDAQVAGPDALRDQRYDIRAKADGSASEEQMRLMLRQLLADRFQLAFHRETRDLRAYALTSDDGGKKLHPSAPGTVPSRQNTAMSSIAKALSMQEFAEFMGDILETPVVDRTNLPGRYDFVLDFTSYLPPLNRPTQLDDFLGALGPALKGELGLKLERMSKTPVEVLVVDHVEKPSEN